MTVGSIALNILLGLLLHLIMVLARFRFRGAIRLNRSGAIDSACLYGASRSGPGPPKLGIGFFVKNLVERLWKGGAVCLPPPRSGASNGAEIGIMRSISRSNLGRGRTWRYNPRGGRNNRFTKERHVIGKGR